MANRLTDKTVAHSARSKMPVRSKCFDELNKFVGAPLGGYH
jgi:hypothetical protein